MTSAPNPGAQADFIAIVPARLASTRLPNKPLAMIGDRPMVVWSAEVARNSGAQQVYVATDDEGIADVVQRHGIPAVLTSADHPSGTDRLAEVVSILGLPDDQIVVNVQGDEPLLPPELVTQVAQLLASHPEAMIATAAHPITCVDEVFNPNIVKVICNHRQEANYFSRAPIPYDRSRFGDGIPEQLQAAYLRHIGLYAYRCGFLRQYQRLEPAITEQLESLEQLRALWHGHRIVVHVTPSAPPGGVDTLADLERVRRHLDEPKTA